MTDRARAATIRIGRAPIPALRPMLARQAPSPFDSDDHLFEVLWGGVRALLTFEASQVRLHGRNLVDLLPRFPELATVGPQLRRTGVVLDGEIVALNRDGKPDATLLRRRFEPSSGRSAPAVTYQVSDLLYVEGRPILSRPLAERRDLLHRVLVPSETASAAEEVGGEGMAFFQAAINLKLPGIVAKDRNGIYLPGRVAEDWREIRVQPAGEFVIGGYTLTRTRRRTTFEGLLLGVPGNSGLGYVGHVTGPFTDLEAKELERTLQPLVSPVCPFAALPGVPRLAYWCRPEIVASVAYSGWRAGSLLRFPMFETLRTDLSPRDIAAPAPNLAAG